jgi:hypothetical protein
LQGVFFNANVPKYLNYAAIGTVIGHEITHGFDDQVPISCISIFGFKILKQIFITETDVRMILINIFAVKIRVFCSKYCQFCKIWILTLVFKKSAVFAQKISENRKRL